jgi:uroporphyrin-III C-methyltransferase
VIYMGLGSLPIISEQLIRHGLSPDTPAALIEKASTPQQRCLRGSLETLPTLAKLHGIKPPALLIIGEVAALHEQLSPAMRAAHCKG